MKLNLTSKTILIIEDYPVMRKAMKGILHSLGAHAIVEAEDGITAINAMKQQNFDIVLCDYNLGEGKNGQQILEEARYKKLILFNSLFIIVSAHQNARFVLNTLENKPDEYLAKPFNAQQLLMRLEKCYARKQNLYAVEREIDKENLARAIYFCDQLIDQNNKAFRSQLLKLRADLAIKTGDFDKANNIYQEVLAQRELSWARLGTGIVAFFRSEHEQAITIFKELITQNPMLMECYDWLADSYQAIGHNSDAEETLNQANEISPHSFFRQKKLAILAGSLEHLDIAEKAYKAVSNLGKYSTHQSPSDFSGLAKVYSKNNKKMEALQTLNSMRQHFPNNQEAELRADTLETEIYQKMEDSKLSEQAFEKVQTLHNQLKDRIPKDLQLDVAKACYLNNDVETADKIITSLVHNHIDDNTVMDSIRHMQSSIGRENSSEALIQQIRQELININNQGVKFFQQGLIKEAFAVFKKAAEKMPHNKTIILNMAKITIHDLKSSGINKENLLLAHQYLKRAKQVGIAQDKIGNLQLEFENITNPQTS